MVGGCQYWAWGGGGWGGLELDGLWWNGTAGLGWDTWDGIGGDGVGWDGVGRAWLGGRGRQGWGFSMSPDDDEQCGMMSWAGHGCPYGGVAHWSLVRLLFPGFGCSFGVWFFTTARFLEFACLLRHVFRCC